MLNVVAIMGRLVADPELRKTPNDVSTTTFTIACDRNYVKPGTERQTDFIDVVAWRSSAEFVCKYFRKGQLIAVNGSLQTRTYEKDGVKRKVYEIVADNLHFADSKGSSGSSGTAPSMSASRPAIEAEPVSYSSGEAEDFSVIDDSEDLPF
jgi:single-strand DNA-binding protein